MSLESVKQQTSETLTASHASENLTGEDQLMERILDREKSIPWNSSA